MNPTVWMALLGAQSMISLTPGAGAINTMSNTLNVGIRRSIWGILGQQLALLIHIAIVAAGLGLLVASSPVAFDVIRYSGAAYLIYLGVRKFLSVPARSGEEVLERLQEGARSLLVRGLWVNLLNPKAIVFFLAFMPQFIRPAEELLPQYAVLGVTVVVVDIAIMLFVFAACARQFQRFTQSQRGQRAMNRTFGTLFVGVGVALAVL
ncbi:LysE family transporter [Arthrobacter monumenti]